MQPWCALAALLCATGGYPRMTRTSQSDCHRLPHPLLSATMAQQHPAMPAVPPPGLEDALAVCEAEVARRQRLDIGMHVQRCGSGEAGGAPCRANGQRRSPLPAGGLTMQQRGEDILTVYRTTKAGQ